MVIIPSTERHPVKYTNFEVISDLPEGPSPTTVLYVNRHHRRCAVLTLFQFLESPKSNSKFFVLRSGLGC